MDTGLKRCVWVDETDELYVAYHDKEWGVPCHDERKLFAMLCLEGAQAGLSWITILRRRQAYYEAFDGFDPLVISTYTSQKIDQLLQNGDIIRNRLKVEAFIANAQAYVALTESGPTLDVYMWSFVNNCPMRDQPQSDKQAIADRLSRDLKQRGFRFVGPTICYAYMQACGLINDHESGCFRSQKQAPTEH